MSVVLCFPIHLTIAVCLYHVFMDLLVKILLDKLDQLLVAIENSAVGSDGKPKRIDKTDRADVEPKFSRHHDISD